MLKSFSILLVEDSDEDYYTAMRILARFQPFEFARCKSGAEVLSSLSTNREGGKLPKLILLDLNLPGKIDGRGVLAQLKANAKLKGIPVVILTTSNNPRDIEHCYLGGAGGYLVKPVDLDKFTNSLEALVDYWFGAVTLPPNAEYSA